MILREEIVDVGKFQKTHALKGELNMILEIDPDYFLQGNPLIVDMDGIYVPFFIESVRPKGSTSYLVKLAGIETEKEASCFVNKEINILKSDFKEISDEEGIIENFLIGYKIINKVTDTIVGEIIDIEDSTTNVLFVLENEKGEEVYIPMNEELIYTINDEDREIIMDLPEGLIDLNSKD
ncbi:MAG: 16S rRNA processing protein RimM [Muribaculaceae bacterium]|nr:16S rRNA processing protein RimM [Muribaculaceae bacterium]